MSRIKDVLRKGKVLFLCVFVTAQIFVPQAVVQAAACKQHSYTDTELVSTTILSEYDYEFIDVYRFRSCHEVKYLYTYVYKCKNCGASAGGGYTKIVTTHSTSICPNIN